MDALKQPQLYTEDDYYHTPENVRVELIEGQFYDLASPSRMHQKILGQLYRTISNYIAEKNGSCEVYPAPFAVKLEEDKDNIVEPDICVICDPNKLTDKGCTGAPDWIIEIISPSTASHDYILKLNLYKMAGVKEYWIVDPHSQKILVYVLANDTFSVQQYSFLDKIKVNIYHDLYIRLSRLDL